MPSVIVQSDASKVTVSLTAFNLTLQRREDLLRIIGLGQTVSVRRTFREGGSPAGSWPPLSATSLRWGHYSVGHKLLIRSSRLLNSIGPSISGSSVSIGSALVYAAPQFLGFDGTQKVKPYSYTRKVRSRDAFRSETVTNKSGRQQKVRRKVASGIATVNVRAFTRHIHIPARNPLVFRPEDPRRIQEEVQTYIKNAGDAAGLEVQQ